ncbi:hypothetical protein AAVH_13852 [Aphelenchoides avenae]|nr:hypothetical protein AAVH_13852 [Aphelenchus avenae]
MFAPICCRRRPIDILCGGYLAACKIVASWAREDTQSSSKEVKHADVLKFKLLAEVEKYPALWDRNSEEFKNEQAKDIIWQQVAQVAGYENGAKAYSAWNSVKDEYTKQRKNASRSDASPTWRFYNAMAFYAPVVDPRPG